MAVAGVAVRSYPRLACIGGVTCGTSLNGQSLVSFRGTVWNDFMECSSSSCLLVQGGSSPSMPITALYNRSLMWERSRAYGNSTESMTVRSVPVQVARDLLKAGHHYLDVRTPEEFGAGHVEGAVNVPYMYRAGTGMNKNLSFIEEVSAQFDKDDEIVVGCQSGKRSLMAAAELLAADFTGVTDMGGGYGAWIQGNLPVAK